MPVMLRLRTRDGTERVSVEDGCTLKDLRFVIQQTFGVPTQDQTLSLQQELLLSKGDYVAEFVDLHAGRKNDGKKLKALGIEHGGFVYLRYSVSREPTPTHAAQHRQELRGGKQTVNGMIAAQTRIERQEHAKCASVSFDQHCANNFQSYVNNTLGFNQMRFGWMFGVVAEADGAIQVHAIYEPEQEGTCDRFDLRRSGGDEDLRVKALAQTLGLTKVGMVFNVANVEESPRDFTLSSFEVRMMAECQAKYGKNFVTAVVMQLEDENESGDVTKQVSIEPFQVSEQCVALFNDGWFHDEPCSDKGMTRMRKPLIVNDGVSKDVTEVDNDRFLVPVKILDHEGPLATSFPVENRLHPIQTSEDLGDALRKTTNTYAKRLLDFHLLLFLSKHLDATDLNMVATQANSDNGEVQEGHKIIIDSLAGL
eukprot:CAMPEP_0119210160 /NCGR_PEP_ID=MMETSP1327-20130426/2038_1 /TAXON_ID=38833 /ORGANISM="Micromonas pusilla, Strain RCC2306" /LENGTH=423 /DNA_ID=CAMNT_0007207143 /DNA_START=26 /DNA_END=1297 /DNA_ORIENTATION=-